MLLTRIKNASDRHKFLRSFIPYYYKHAFELRDKLPVYHKLKKHTGQIAGDAHVENFGFIVNNDNRPVFTLNDFDDVAEAPLFLDVMRLSQSASYIGDFKQKKLIEAYRQGLTGSVHKKSKYIKKLEEKSLKEGADGKAKFTKTPDGPRFAVKTEPATDATSEEVDMIRKIITNKYGTTARLHDSYSTMKLSGGSAFGKRYHGLIEYKDEMHIVEFKEILDGGVGGHWTNKSVTNEERVNKALETYLGGQLSNNLDVIKIEDKYYFLRLKLDGNESIDLNSVSKKELPLVIEDEFYLLGQLHRRSLGNNDQGVANYVADLNTVTPEDWEKSVEVMKKDIKKAYKKANE